MTYNLLYAFQIAVFALYCCGMLLKKTAPILVIIGPSASGKSTIVRELAAQNIIEVTPSWTTRPKRSDDTDDNEHMFCDEETFDEKLAKGYFIDTAEFFGLPYRYGLPVIYEPKNGLVPLIMLRVMVLELLAKHYTNITIYEIDTPKNDAKKRLEEREKSGIDNGTRLSDFDKEVAKGRQIADRSFENTNVVQSVKMITNAIAEDFVLQ